MSSQNNVLAFAVTPKLLCIDQSVQRLLQMLPACAVPPGRKSTLASATAECFVSAAQAGLWSVFAYDTMQYECQGMCLQGMQCSCCGMQKSSKAFVCGRTCNSSYMMHRQGLQRQLQIHQHHLSLDKLHKQVPSHPDSMRWY